MSEVKRLANEALERLCKKYPEHPAYQHRGLMQASFEIFRNEIVFLEYCEQCEHKTKLNIQSGIGLLFHWRVEYGEKS
jgi:hypothetical protein